MRNPYKKFQNSSIHGSKVMLCIKKREERTDRRKDGRMNNPEAICPPNFFEVGGIIKSKLLVKGYWNFTEISVKFRGSMKNIEKSGQFH